MSPISPLRPIRFSRLPGLFSRGLALVLLLSLGSACAALQQRRQDTADIETEHTAAERRLAETPVARALLDVARYRDARRGTVEIAQWTRHPSSEVRAAAYRALGLVGGPVAAARLAGGVEDVDPEVRQAAVFGLSQSWSWPMAKLHARQLQEEQALLLDPQAAGEDARFIAIARSELALAEAPDWDEALVAGAGAEHLFAAQGLLCRARKRVAEAPLQLPRLGPQALELAGADATYALSQCGPHPDQKSDASLIATLQRQSQGDDVEQAVSAWRALGRFDPEQVLDLLASGLVSAKSPRLRLAALRGVIQLGPPGEAVLLSALSSEEPVIASVAAAALARSGDSAVWDRLTGILSRKGGLEGSSANAQLEALVQLSVSDEAGQWGSDPELIEAALASEELVIRRAGLSLAIASAALAEDASGLEGLLARAERSEDTGMLVVATLALASRSEDIVEGALLSRLASENLLVAGIAAAALGEREGAHITQRLIDAYGQAEGPERWELRESLAVALLGRPGLSGALVLQMRDDESAPVRLAVYRYAIEQEERSDLGPVPQEQPLPDLPDAYFGVGDVTGASVVTSRGTLDLLLFPDVAPGAVANFVALVEQGFYTGLLFHRVVPDFVVQAGDPSGTGWGGPGYNIRDEFSPLPFLRGSLGMARSHKDTAGSQWFITHSRQRGLDRHYTLFGQMSGGWDVLDSLEVGDRIESITIRRSKP